MKTIKPGLTAHERKLRKCYWWTNQSVIRGECDGKYRLEIDDRHRPQLVAQPNGIVILVEAFVICPNCNANVKLVETPPNYVLLEELDHPLTVEEAQRKANR